MARKLKGIRRKRHKWETFVRVRGQLHTATWPLTTPVEELRDWLVRQVTIHGGAAHAADGFAADVATYLTRVAAMPTFDQVTAHLALWVHELGADRPTRSITSAEIDVVIQGWLTDGLAGGTVRKRRSTLHSFFQRMVGKGKSPVAGTTNPKPPKLEARGLDYLTIARILDAMPSRRSAKPGVDRGPSLAKIRAAVLAYTGLPPGQLGLIRPTDLQLTVGTVRVPGRKKGAGAAARTIPLTAEGLAAFKTFHVAQAYGSYAIEAVNRCFKNAAARVGLDRDTVHLYDLRHSFGAEIYRVTRDLATVARFLGHAPGSVVTARYAQAGDAAVDAAAAQAFSAALATARQLSLKPVATAGRKRA